MGLLVQYAGPNSGQQQTGAGSDEDAVGDVQRGRHIAVFEWLRLGQVDEQVYCLAHVVGANDDAIDDSLQARSGLVDAVVRMGFRRDSAPTPGSLLAPLTRQVWRIAHLFPADRRYRRGGSPILTWRIIYNRYDGAMELVPRHLEAQVRELLLFSPILTVEGARQVGKSTLAQVTAADAAAVSVTMDDELTRRLAQDDPMGFLGQAAEQRLIIDEIQRTPELVLPLKLVVDRDRRPGRFLLTGSANLLRVPGAEDSLAGRAITTRLEPFSQGEIELIHDDWVTAVCSLDHLPPAGNRSDLVNRIARGGYPAVQDLPESARVTWLRSYSARLVERDSVELGNLQVAVLRRLLRLIAGTPGGELNKERLGEQLSISRQTVTRYLDVLEALFLIRTVPAWSRSLSQRQIARPKCFVTDSGLAAAMLNQSVEHLTSMHGSDHFGHLLECFVVNELMRQRGWTITPFEVSHYRDRHGAEIDFIIEVPQGVIAVEVKAAQAPTRAHFKHLSALRDRLGSEFLAGVVLNSATATRAGDRLWALPVSSLWRM